MSPTLWLAAMLLGSMAAAALLAVRTATPSRRESRAFHVIQEYASEDAKRAHEQALEAQHNAPLRSEVK